MSGNRVDLCVWTCYDDEHTLFLLTSSRLPRCPHMQPHADRRRPFPPSPRAPQWRQGAGRRVPAHAAGEQLAFHRARPDAQIEITTRREDMHYTRSVLLTMRLMQFVTCCALPFAHQSLTSTLFFLREPARWDFWHRLLFLWRIYYKRDLSIWLWTYFFWQSHCFDT